MRYSRSKLHLRFLKEISGEPYSINKLRSAFREIAYYYHICGIEVELIGNFNLAPEDKEILLYEEEGDIPIGEPIRFTYEINEHRNIVVFVYPSERRFDEEEEEELEIYALETMQYFERMDLENAYFFSATFRETTGMPNAHGYLRQASELLKKTGTLRNYTAFYFNIKDFGIINRKYGKDYGDEILSIYAGRIKSFSQKGEIIGHLGGDNFLALIYKEKQQDFLNLLDDISVTVKTEGKETVFPIKVTVGVWEINSEISDIGDIISRPSIALNQAKNVLHKNIAFASDNLIKGLSQQRAVLSNFERALSNEEFLVYYQPKVDSVNGKLVGAESLVRWFHDKEMISPGVFIPALEENDKSLMLDYYVLRRTCRDIREWIEMGLEPVPVSVNFSRKDLRDGNLAENINSIIEEAGIEKRLIEIELTETYDVKEHGVLSGFISKLYKLGIMTAIDDFGSGYSSLSTLREFKIHTLKLDRSFVNTDDFSWKDEIILRDIIHMAGELGMEVLCEGVERYDQLALMNSVGCFVIQGYYFDRPLPHNDFELRLKEKEYKI